MKKILGVLICLCIASYFSVAEAHGTFTWFGLKRNNTEIVVQSSSNAHHHPPKHHKIHKPKPKPKPKHKHKWYKGPKKHHWYKWWDD